MNRETPSLPSVTSLDDSPFDDEAITKVISSSDPKRRCRSYPKVQYKEKESGPKNPVEILTSLHTTSSELSEHNRTTSVTSRKRPPRLTKMRSVDPECYSYKCHIESRKDDNDANMKENIALTISSNPGNSKCADNEVRTDQIITNGAESDSINSSNNNSVDIDNRCSQERHEEVTESLGHVIPADDDITKASGICTQEDSSPPPPLVQPESSHPKDIPISANMDKSELMSSTSRLSDSASSSADAVQRNSLKGNTQVQEVPHQCTNSPSTDKDHSGEQNHGATVDDVENTSSMHLEQNGDAEQRRKDIKMEDENVSPVSMKDLDNADNVSTLSNIRASEVRPNWGSVITDSESRNSSFQCVEIPFTAYRSSEFDIGHDCMNEGDRQNNDAESSAPSCHGDSENLESVVCEERIQPCTLAFESASNHSNILVAKQPSPVEPSSIVDLQKSGSIMLASLSNHQSSAIQSSLSSGVDSSHLCDTTTQSLPLPEVLPSESHDHIKIDQVII